MRLFCLTVPGAAILTLAVCAPVGAGDADKEKAKLQGTWTLIKATIRGEDKTKDLFGGGATVTFAGATVTMKMGNESHEGTFKIVDATKTPRHIDLSVPKQKDTPAIYQIEGDTLRMATPEKGGGRPQSFDARDRQEITLTFKKTGK
jgi:uncharacterized protein (TIGR03067 family)